MPGLARVGSMREQCAWEAFQGPIPAVHMKSFQEVQEPVSWISCKSRITRVEEQGAFRSPSIFAFSTHSLTHTYNILAHFTQTITHIHTHTHTSVQFRTRWLSLPKPSSCIPASLTPTTSIYLPTCPLHTSKRRTAKKKSQDLL